LAGPGFELLTSPTLEACGITFGCRGGLVGNVICDTHFGIK